MINQPTGQPESTQLTNVFISYQPATRQGKSLDYVYILAYLIDVTVEKCNEKAVKSIGRISHTARNLPN